MKSWETALKAVEGRLSQTVFEQWLRPIRCVEEGPHHLRLAAPSVFVKEWFESNFLPIIKDELSRQGGQGVDVTVEVEPTLAGEVVPASEAASAPALSTFLSAGSGGASPHPSLNARYHFESFVVGPSNQLAYAASRAVADSPGQRYNPLFICGGVGLGKTHLLQAIGHEAHLKHPARRILYMKGERYVSDCIRAIEGGRLDDFRRHFAEAYDVLLIDDIHFLAGKHRSQEEFFHTFNELHESGRQIVLTSDRMPREIPDLEQRLLSRFEWGLIADIAAPELETRVAIVRRKAAFEGIRIDDDVALFLGEQATANVRELEGALIRLAAMSSLTGEALTLSFAREKLGSPRATRSIAIEEIHRVILQHFRLKQGDLIGRGRHQQISEARRIAMYLTRRLCRASYPEIGRAFGGKDHTTVLASVRKIEARLEHEPELRALIDELERRIRTG
jgi:chromosomal replication initiator protein